jgi:hypothetical protein
VLQTIKISSAPAFTFDNYITLYYKTVKITVLNNLATIQSAVVDSGNLVVTVTGSSPTVTLSALISFVSPAAPPVTS